MPTIHPVLSVLIPAVPSRIPKVQVLLDKIQNQISRCGAETRVEVLCLLDNKARSVGLKRQALLNSARGLWLAYVDDDDDVMDLYLEQVLLAIDTVGLNKNVIVFDQLTIINGGSPLVVQHGIEYPNTEMGPLGAMRKPWMHNIWRASLAKTAVFPDASYAEDTYWLEQLWPQVTPETQHRIERVKLHMYRFDVKLTEAEPVFPVKP